jgi:hypothetical protein
MNQRRHAATVAVRFPKDEKNLRAGLGPRGQIDNTVLDKVILKIRTASAPSRKKISCCGSIISGHQFL